MRKWNLAKVVKRLDDPSTTREEMAYMIGELLHDYGQLQQQLAEAQARIHELEAKCEKPNE